MLFCIMHHTLANIRNWLTDHDSSVVICSDSDPHCSEIPSKAFSLRSYISGFEGSFGTMIVTMHEALLWTDTRYYLQVRETLPQVGITPRLLTELDTPQHWIATNTPHETSLHFFHISVSEFRKYEQHCAPRNCKSYLYYPEELWPDRPPVDSKPIRVLDSGSSSQVIETIDVIRKQMENVGCSIHLISTLDDIAYITRLRASELPYQQVFHAFLVIYPDNVQLFLRDGGQLTVEAMRRIGETAIEIKHYFDIVECVRAFPPEARVLIDPQRTDAGFIPFISSDIAYKTQPSSTIRAIKTNDEIQHLKSTHILDGVAMVRTIQAIHEADIDAMTEIDVAQICTQYRAQNSDFIENSFAPICASGPHAAMPHFDTENNSSLLKHNSVLLIDTGGQYEHGTTDITRVLRIGNSSTEVQRDYTLVLKAHIHVLTQEFPIGTTGRDLHIICKSLMWRQKKNFLHGTGHGVGFALGVHEFPPNISTRNGDTVLSSGMVFSIEPGLYIEGSHGIRIENLVYVAPSESSPANANFLRLVSLTLCPYERDLICLEMLSPQEISWIDYYHEEVYSTLSAHLEEKEQKKLKKLTDPLQTS